MLTSLNPVCSYFHRCIHVANCVHVANASDNRKYCIVDNLPIAEFILTPNGTLAEMNMQHAIFDKQNLISRKRS